MAFHIQQGHPTPQTLEPGANGSFTIEVFVDGNPVDPGEIIQVRLPEDVVFPPTGEIRYMKIDQGINELLPIESRDPDGRLVRFKAKAIGNQPEGFYSVNVQAHPNPELDEWTVLDGLSIGTTSSKLSFRISPPQPVEQKVYGYVEADGTVISGSDFTVIRSQASTYTVTFTNPFSSLPTVLATVQVAGPLANVTVHSLTTCRALITTSNADTYVPMRFSFMAMGPAAPKP
jgi:hypothetical protein